MSSGSPSRRQSHVHTLSPRPTMNSSKRRCTGMSSQLNHVDVPAYLKHTLYAELLKEQTRNSQAGSDRIRNNSVDELDLRLPTKWNPDDKSRNIEVSATGLELLYTGPGKMEADAASVRSDYPIRPQCGIYYYEMKVISKGADGFIGIGFCGPKNKLDRLPGWDIDSWGYHGDDGHSFQERGQGNKYGPQFTTGDVIGCGIDLISRTAFYSKNGTYLGPAFASIKTNMDLYPCVGLRTVGERVAVNFGQDPFAFDIVQYVKEQKIKVMGQVAKQPPPMDEAVMDRLVISYLVYQGYMKTATAAIRDIHHISGQTLPLSHSGCEPTDLEEKDMYARQSVKTAVRSGDMDLALRLLQMHFSDILENEQSGHDIIFELKCRKLIEMMRRYNAQRSRQKRVKGIVKNSRSDSKSNKLNGNGYDHHPTRSSDEDLREVDSKNQDANGFRDSGLVLSDDEMVDSMMESMMAYGRELRDEYYDDNRPEIQQKLRDSFSLFAYSEPVNSPMAHLLGDAGREDLANKLNAVILVLQQRPDQAPLESIYRQVVESNQQLACLGYPESLLLNPPPAPTQQLLPNPTFQGDTYHTFTP